ncbi:MAG: protein translocase subunit SecD [Candidatus Woesebacteria bacterium]
MNFSQALRSYVILLVIAVLALVLLLPATMKVDFGKQSVCQTVPSFLSSVCQGVYPLADSAPLTLTRPPLKISLFGSTFARDLEYRYGLDVRGGSEVTLVADMSNISLSQRASALESAKEVISRRINLYGLSESTVTTAVSNDSYRLIAAIPGITESSQITSLIGSTAQLGFREYVQPATASAIASPSSMLVSDFVPTDLTGKDLQEVTAQFDSSTNLPVISLQFTEEGKKKFAQITKRNIGKPLAIFLDEYPISAPNVQSEITDGRAQISGNFTTEEAKSLSATLNAGALPAPISVLSQRTVEASLGDSSIHNSIRAGVIGITLVIVFLIALYGLKGVLAAVVVVFYAILTLTMYKLIPLTLTLPGIAGFLLSVGMSVDTIILVFERLREEETQGHSTVSRLISKSFGRAWGSIKDANAVTLVSAFVLANPFSWVFLNTSGMVRGFALTLALGIVLNLFTGMLVLRVLLTLFYKPKNV